MELRATEERTVGPRVSRRSLVKGAAWAAPVIAAATAAPAIAASPSACAPADTLFDAQSRGRLLSGSILGTDLDTVVSLEGAHAQAFASLGQNVDTQQAALAISALSAIQVDLGGVTATLSDVLTLVASQNVGTLNQFAYANAEAETSGSGEIGASGAVDQASGAITLDENSQDVPELGSLDLRSILAQVTGNQAVADLVASVTDLDLEIGAVAGRAFFDSLCEVPDEATRDYLLASLRLAVTSGVVGDVLAAIPTTLAVDTQDVWDLLGAIPLLGGLLAALGQSALTVAVTIDTNSLTGPLPDDPDAALQIDLRGDGIVLDLASLLGGAYTGEVSPYLNGLAPNTRLFVDAALPTGTAVSLVDTWADSLLDRLKDLVTISITAGNPDAPVLATGLRIQGSLRDFLEGTGTVKFILTGVEITLLPALLSGLLEDIGSLVENALSALFDTGSTLDTALTGVSSLLSLLFDVLSGVLAITVNAENDASGSVPDYYTSITAGRYDVAALHLAVLGALDLLDLSIARGSVGENIARA